MLRMIKKLFVLLFVFTLIFPILSVAAEDNYESYPSLRAVIEQDNDNSEEAKKLINLLEEGDEIYEAIEEYKRLFIQFEYVLAQQSLRVEKAKKDGKDYSEYYKLLEFTDEEYDYFAPLHNKLLKKMKVTGSDGYKLVTEVNPEKNLEVTYSGRLEVYMIFTNEYLEQYKNERLDMDIEAMMNFYN